MKHTALFIAALLAAAAAQAQTIEDVLRSVEQNNVELKAARKGNEAAALEAKQVNNLEGLSVEYSPFFSGEVGGIASSELVVSQGFDFPTLYGARKKANRLQGDVRDMEYQTARRDILLQFLVESLLLCLAGGILGILAGRFTSIIISSLKNWPVSPSIGAILLSVIVSAVIGIGFGFYPAWRASRLNPIDALHYE